MPRRALAHVVGNCVEAAYQDTDLVGRRGGLIEQGLG